MVTATRPTEQSVMIQVGEYNSQPQSAKKRLVDFIEPKESSSLEEAMRDELISIANMPVKIIKHEIGEISEPIEDIRKDRDLTSPRALLRQDSIRKYGIISPVVVNKIGNMIRGVDGWTRVNDAKVVRPEQEHYIVNCLQYED